MTEEEIVELQNMPFFVVDKLNIFNKILILENRGRYAFDLQIVDSDMPGIGVFFDSTGDIIHFVDRGAEIVCYYKVQEIIEFEITFCIQYTSLTRTTYQQEIYLNHFCPERSRISIPTKVNQ